MEHITMNGNIMVSFILNTKQTLLIIRHLQNIYRIRAWSLSDVTFHFPCICRYKITDKGLFKYGETSLSSIIIHSYIPVFWTKNRSSTPFFSPNIGCKDTHFLLKDKQ